MGSNVVISLTRKVIPDKVRIPAFITIIAGFVTLVQMLVKAYAPEVNDKLGIFLPLIVVNCIILARAEMFASKNKVLPSILDALGMGVGFTAALVLMGSIRELLGSGSLFGVPITSNFIDPMIVMILPAGGFFEMCIRDRVVIGLPVHAGTEGNSRNSPCRAAVLADGAGPAAGINGRLGYRKGTVGQHGGKPHPGPPLRGNKQGGLADPPQPRPA